MPFSVLFIGGFVPLAWSCIYFIMGIAQGLGEGAALWAAMLGVHLAVDGLLLYALAALLSRLVFALLPMSIATRAVGVVIAAQVLAAFLPIYMLDGDSRGPVFYSLWDVVFAM